jgi:flagellum-specific ATP synthase
VLALVGERGREVRDFVERDLGDGRRRCVIVAETADRSPVRRVKTAFAATAIAEHFREGGRQVLLLVDSLSRVAFAQREVGLAAGEPPASRGYPPSVYSMLPRLLERAGAVRGGSITAFYSVLAEGDDPNDPVADAARSVLDGHVWLSRSLGDRGQFPAIDVLSSVSRLARDAMDAGHAAAAARVRALLAAHRDAQDLLAVGAYAKGSDPEVDRAVRLKPAIDAFLRQDVGEVASWDATRAALMDLARRAEA